MTEPAPLSRESDLIQQELAAAMHALNRYYDLTAIEYQAQKDRLASIEERLARLEQSNAKLRIEVDLVVNSNLWRTLVRGGKLIEKVPRADGDGH
jgi:uncharacterized protein involved in exopolysaccharide biosynthesis